MNIYMVNSRGIKSKYNSLKSIIEELKPTMFGITETMLGNNEEFEMEGYVIIRNDRNKEGGGVLLAIKDDLKGVITQVINDKNKDEVIWVIIGSKIKTRIGIIYAPQESRTSKEELQGMYDRLQDQVEKAKLNGERVVLMGDFNCKVGKCIPGNKEDKSKAGQLLINMVEHNQLKILNGTNQCKGLWTRIEGESRSVLDYMIVLEEDSNSLQMNIDEAKLYTPFRLIQKGTNVEECYTDHCAIIVEIDWSMTMKANKIEKKVMTEKSYKEYKRKIQEDQVHKIWQKDGTITELYEEWNDNIMKIVETCKRPPRKKSENKTIRKLISAKRKLKKDVKKESNVESKERMRTRIILLAETILAEEQKQYSNKVSATVENLRKEGGGMNETTFWEFKKKLERRKEEHPHTIRNENGETVETSEEIKEAYKTFYEKLFEQKKPTTHEEKTAEERVTSEIKKIREAAETQTPLEIEKEEVEKVIKKLKNKKAKDEYGWSNVLVKKGGEEVIVSLYMMFQRVTKNQETPEQWERMRIKSLFKNKGSRMDLKNRRGIFITNTISKIYEKVLLSKFEADLQINEFQSGGRKKRSTVDNWVILIAIMDNNRRMGRCTYIIMADAEKCFDKLWLQDCLVDLKEAGVREREVDMIYRMNERAEIVIDTPSGMTESIKVKEIVKQGTVYGPLLCCVNSVKVNEMSENTQVHLTPQVEVGAMAYVDDIMGAGSKDLIENVGKNLAEMERTKRYTFNNENGKSHYMVIKTCKKKNVEEPEISVQKGKITKTAEYKYVGNWLNENGTVETQLKAINKKAKGMVAESKRIANEARTGKMSTSVLLLLYERTILPAITYNLQVWTNWRVKDWELLEKTQAESLKTLFHLPQSTPYWGIISELGIWPLRCLINYQQLMLWQDLVSSDDSRISKKVIMEQKEYNWEIGWYKELKETADKYQVDLVKVETSTKSDWKKEIKHKINEWVRLETTRKSTQMTKLKRIRYQEFGRQEYLRYTTLSTCCKILRLKLEMYDVGNNMGNHHTCIGCGAEESIEHLTKCNETEKLMGRRADESWILTRDEEELLEMGKYIEKYQAHRPQQ